MLSSLSQLGRFRIRQHQLAPTASTKNFIYVSAFSNFILQVLNAVKYSIFAGSSRLVFISSRTKRNRSRTVELPMEQISNLIKSEGARYLFVAAVASFISIQTHTIYRDIRSKSNKEKLNRELKDLYKDEEASNRLSSVFKAMQNNQQDDSDANGGLVAAIERGAEFVASVATGHGAGFDEGLIREQLSRNYAFFGEEGMAQIRRATVVVVGCGGVGSWAAVMLART